VDPTAAITSTVNRPTKATGAGQSAAAPATSNASSNGAQQQQGGANNPARRVQIFNSSDAFSPDQARELTVFAKPESSKEFLRASLSAHYLVSTLSA
jgi:hypothetical protein